MHSYATVERLHKAGRRAKIPRPGNCAFLLYRGFSMQEPAMNTKNFMANPSHKQPAEQQTHCEELMLMVILLLVLLQLSLRLLLLSSLPVAKNMNQCVVWLLAGKSHQIPSTALEPPSAWHAQSTGQNSWPSEQVQQETGPAEPSCCSGDCGEG